MAEYRLTPAAENDLEAIWVHTLRQWGVEQANNYTDMLAKIFAELAQSPRRIQSAFCRMPSNKIEIQSKWKP